MSFLIATLNMLHRLDTRLLIIVLRGYNLASVYNF